MIIETEIMRGGVVVVDKEDQQVPSQRLGMGALLKPAKEMSATITAPLKDYIYMFFFFKFSLFIFLALNLCIYLFISMLFVFTLVWWFFFYFYFCSVPSLIMGPFL